VESHGGPLPQLQSIAEFLPLALAVPKSCPEQKQHIGIKQVARMSERDIRGGGRAGPGFRFTHPGYMGRPGGALTPSPKNHHPA